MPLITINFPNNLNTSVQVGDMAYYVSSINNTTIPSSTATSNINLLGEITEVGIDYIIVDIPAALWNSSNPPSADDFIMFSKDNQANMSSLLGYFALFRFQNNSNEDAELFSIGADYFESSK
tara:strand:+ start:347 stop:712 length:366 start_codon:yes stop_codon:yes gene_type:complete